MTPSESMARLMLGYGYDDHGLTVSDLTDGGDGGLVVLVVVLSRRRQHRLGLGRRRVDVDDDAGTDATA